MDKTSHSNRGLEPKENNTEEQMVSGTNWMNSILSVSLQHKMVSLLIHEKISYWTVWIFIESDSLLFTRVEKRWATSQKKVQIEGNVYIVIIL